MRVGGYLAADSRIIAHLRRACQANIYAESLSVPVTQQIITSLSIISGELLPGEGRSRVTALARNAHYFMTSLRRAGFIVYGADSPVVPLLLFHPAKIPAFSRMMMERGIAVVVVGYPATPIITSRVRFCLSASHTLDDLKWAIQVINEVGDELGLKVSSQSIDDEEEDGRWG